MRDFLRPVRGAFAGSRHGHHPQQRRDPVLGLRRPAPLACVRCLGSGPTAQWQGWHRVTDEVDHSTPLVEEAVYAQGNGDACRRDNRMGHHR